MTFFAGVLEKESMNTCVITVLCNAQVPQPHLLSHMDPALHRLQNIYSEHHCRDLGGVWRIGVQGVCLAFLCSSDRRHKTRERRQRNENERHGKGKKTHKDKETDSSHVFMCLFVSPQGPLFLSLLVFSPFSASLVTVWFFFFFLFPSCICRLSRLCFALVWCLN